MGAARTVAADQRSGSRLKCRNADLLTVLAGVVVFDWLGYRHQPSGWQQERPQTLNPVSRK